MLALLPTNHIYLNIKLNVTKCPDQSILLINSGRGISSTDRRNEEDPFSLYSSGRSGMLIISWIGTNLLRLYLGSIPNC